MGASNEQPRTGAPLKRLGRYELFEKVASGGMATVFVGRALGSGGFERVVAVKVCHEHLRENDEFVTMFLDEARLSAKIRHPNVVGVIDASDVDGLYLVMEYIDGAPLTALLRSAATRNVGVPPPVASRVISDALLGLHAAHELTDAAGNAYDIVHRDVSPPNILVGLDGITRIADFGVAKAAARVTSTRDGQIKGKIAYMAPEQFDGIATVRSDVFAAGVVLWESLVGSRLFPGNTDAETMRAVIVGTIRKPTDVRPDVPAALDDVVMRALDRDPDKRWPTAAAFADALEDCGAGLASARAVTAYLKKDLGEYLESRQGQVRNFLAADVPQSDSGVVMREQSRPNAASRGAAQNALSPGPKDATPSAPNLPAHTARPASPKIETFAKSATPPRPAASTAKAPPPKPASRPVPEIEEIESDALKSIVASVPVASPVAVTAAPATPSPLRPLVDDLDDDVQTVARAPAWGSPSSPALSPLASPPSSPALSPLVSPPSSPALSPLASPPSSPALSPLASPPSSPALSPLASPPSSPALSPLASPPSSPTLSPLASPPSSPALSPLVSPPSHDYPSNASKPNIALVATIAIAIAIAATGIGIAVARMGRSHSPTTTPTTTSTSPTATETPHVAPTPIPPPTPVAHEPVAPPPMIAPVPVAQPVAPPPTIAPVPVAQPVAAPPTIAPAPVAQPVAPPPTIAPAPVAHQPTRVDPPTRAPSTTTATNPPAVRTSTTRNTNTRSTTGTSTPRRTGHGFIPDDI